MARIVENIDVLVVFAAGDSPDDSLIESFVAIE